jgi:hypothetical protein
MLSALLVASMVFNGLPPRAQAVRDNHPQKAHSRIGTFSTVLKQRWQYTMPGKAASRVQINDAAVVDMHGHGPNQIVLLESDNGGTFLRFLSSSGQLLRRTRLGEDATDIAAAQIGKSNDLIIVTWSAWSHETPCYDGKGKLKWRLKPPTAAVDSMAVADIDGDGKPEVIVGCNGSTGLYVLNSDGTVRWKNTSVGNCWNVAFARTGKKTGLVLTAEASGQIHAFDTNGHEQFVASDPDRVYLTSVTSADLEHTGNATIIGMNSDGPQSMSAFSSSGNFRWKVGWSGADSQQARSLESHTAAVSVGARGVLFVVDLEGGLRAFGYDGKIIFPKKQGLNLLTVHPLRDAGKEFLVTFSSSKVTCYVVNPP